MRCAAARAYKFNKYRLIGGSGTRHLIISIMDFVPIYFFLIQVTFLLFKSLEEVVNGM